MTEQLPDQGNGQPSQPQGEQFGQPQGSVPPGSVPPPPPPNYGAPQAQPAANPADLAGTVTLNYWLSVFFAWLPALIFYFTEKGKSPLSDQYHRENLNFSLLRTGAIIVASFLLAVPVLGWLVYLVAWIGGFVLHIMVAVKAKERFEAGQEPGFLFNIPLIK